MDLESKMDALLKELESCENDDLLATRAYNSVIRKLGLYGPRSRYERIFSIISKTAAILFIPLAVCLALVLSAPEKESRWVEVIVPAGQHRDLTLSDGTQLTLNAGTRLTYPLAFNGKSRELFLDGEISADIAHDENAPFIIHSGDLELKVLGTKFDMKAYSGSRNVDVFLHEGKVMLNAKDSLRDNSIFVSPGQHVQFNRDSLTFVLNLYDKEIYQSFAKASTLSFNKVTMHDVAIELERIFGQEIVIKDHQLAERRILAYFSNGECLDEILNSLNFDGRLVLEKTADTIYLSLK